MLGGTADWALKRVARFVLKRQLGRLLRTDLDLDTLDVALGEGSLSLRCLLLDRDYINSQLGPGARWEVTAAYVGAARATVPITSLYSQPCSIELDEVLLTVRPRTASGVASAPTAEAAAPRDGRTAGAADEDPPDTLDEVAAGVGRVADGVRLIAGGLEALLQGLALSARRVAVRVELPAPADASDRAGTAAAAQDQQTPGGAVAVLHLDELTYSGNGPGVAAGKDAPDAKAASGGATLHKHVSFSGLTLDLEPLAASEDAAAAPSVSVTTDAAEPVSGQSLSAAATGSEAAQESSWSMRVDSSSSCCSGEDSAAGGTDTACVIGGGSSDGESHSSASQRGCQHNCAAIISGTGGAGLSGRLALRLAWPEAGSGSGGGGGSGSYGPRVAAQLHLDPLRCQLRQRHLPLLSDAGAALAAVFSRQSQSPAPSSPCAAAAAPVGHRSFLEGVLLPDFGGLVADTLGASGAWGLGNSSAAAVPGTSPPSGEHGTASGAYFDAESVLGSMRQGLSNTFFSATASLHGLGTEDGVATRQQQELRWDLRASAAGCTLVLWYPATAPAAAAAAAAAAGGVVSSPQPSAAGACLASAPAASAAVDAAAGAAAGGGAATSQRSQQPADSSQLRQPQQQSPQRNQGQQEGSQQQQEQSQPPQHMSDFNSKGDGTAGEAFSQPFDSLQQGGESFMSAASQLRWSGLTASGTTAPGLSAPGGETGTGATAAAGSSGSAGQHTAAGPAAASTAEWDAAGAAESSDDGDYGRLELDCTDVVINAAGGGASNGVTAAARLYALSALEYLPSEDARACRSPSPEEAAQVLQALPPLQGGTRPAPYFLPPQAGPSSPEAVPHLVQVLPVLSCAGSPRSEGGRPSATLRLRLGSDADASLPAAPPPAAHRHTGGTIGGSIGGGSRAGGAGRSDSAAATQPAAEAATAEPMAEVAMRPVTLWLGLPLLARLEAFAEPLLLAAAEAAVAAAEMAAAAAETAAAAAAEGGRHGGQRVSFDTGQEQRSAAARKTAVAAAIDSILDSLQEFGADGQPGEAATAQRRFGVSVSAAHVCTVLALPPPNPQAADGPLHGHRYLAVDLFPATGRSTGCGSGKAEAATPLLVARCSSDAQGSNLEVDCAAARATAYLVGDPFAVGAAPHAARQLTANCIVNALPAPGDACALTAEARWSPTAVASPSDLDAAWDFARRHTAAIAVDTTAAAAGKAVRQAHPGMDSPEGVAFREQLLAAASAFLRVRAPAVRAQLCQADLAAMAALATSAAAWREGVAAAALAAGWPIAPAGPQAALLVDAGVTLVLRPALQGGSAAERDAAAFSLAAEEVRLFGVSCLGGKLDASTTLLQAGGITLRRGLTTAQSSHGGSRPASGRSSGHSSRPAAGRGSSTPAAAAAAEDAPAVLLSCAANAGLDIVHVQRPVQQPGAEVVEAAASIVLRGVTLATDPAPQQTARTPGSSGSAGENGGPPSVDWPAHLAGCFACAGVVQPAAAATADAAAPTPQRHSPSTNWTVSLQDCAVRYEPPPQLVDNLAAPGVAAALLLGAGRWGCGHSTASDSAAKAVQSPLAHPLADAPDGGAAAAQAAQPVVLQSLSLWVAAADEPGPGWGPGDIVDVPAVPLPACGYLCVAQETQISISVSTPTEAEAGPLDIEVSNSRLVSSLSREALQCLTRLAAQCAPPAAAASSTSSASGRNGGTSTSRRHRRRASAAGMPDPEVPARLTKDEVQEMAQREGLMEASVFLGGGWLDGSEADAPQLLPAVDGAHLCAPPAAAGSLAQAKALSPPEVVPDDVGSEASSEQPPGLIEGFLDCSALVGRSSSHASPREVLAGPLEGGDEFDADVLEWEERGIWYTPPDADLDVEGSAPEVHDDYVAVAGDGGTAIDGGSTWRGALAEPQEGAFPQPATRFTLCNVNAIIALCADAEEAEPSRRMAARRGGRGGRNGSSCRPPGRHEGGGARRVEVDVSGLSVRMERYGEQDSHDWRLAMSVHDFEVRDCAVAKDARSPWRRMLGHHATLRAPRDPAGCIFQAQLAAARPEPGIEELELSVDLLPLRVRLDQGTCLFLAAFLAPSTDEAPVLVSAPGASDEDDPALATDPDDTGPVFSKVDISGWSVTVDYKPRRVDLGALRAGALVEVLNLVPWGGVALALPPVSLADAEGWPAVGRGVAAVYINDITTHQAHKFVTGVAPIAALVRLGTAAAPLAAIPSGRLAAASRRGSRRSPQGRHSGGHPTPSGTPRDTPRGDPRDGSRRGRRAALADAVPLERQLRRGLTSLARAVALEALGLSATVAGGAQAVLQGSSGASHGEQPAGVGEGLRQAGARLQGGFGAAARAVVLAPAASVRSGDASLGAAIARGVRAVPGAAAAPAGALAGAVRALALGTRNGIDPERYAQRRLDRGLP